MTVSKLAQKTILTSNCSSRYGNRISRITPHYMAGYATGEACARSFVPASRKASANYCIGYDGGIVCNVLEENRAWTSGNAENDRRAITIECANYMDNKNGHVYGQLPDATWKSLVALCADICDRYGFRASYTGNTSGTLTMHKWFQDTDCPGPWFSKQFSRLATEINAVLDGTSPKPTPDIPVSFAGMYECRVPVLNVRDAPSLNGNVVAEYHKYEWVTLDDWYTIADGYVWGRYTGETSGKKRYVAVGRNTGRVEGDDFLMRL